MLTFCTISILQLNQKVLLTFNCVCIYVQTPKNGAYSINFMVVLTELFSNDQMLPHRQQCKPHVHRTAHLKRHKIDEAKFHMKAIIECVNVHRVNLLIINMKEIGKKCWQLMLFLLTIAEN